MGTQQGIVWLATSAAEIARARDVLRTLTPAGVLDELGFGILQSAFAERFYPATTTIMTRARYLVFVPALFRYLERTRIAQGKNADRVSRDLQFALRTRLLENVGSGRGVIGADSGRDVVRPPSNVYWNALASLGIASRRITEAKYLEQLSSGGGRRTHVVDDDKAVHADEIESLWDPSFRVGHVLNPDGSFPASLAFDLTPGEAQQLAKRYRSLQWEGHGSLLVHMIAWGERAGVGALAEMHWPWDVPHLDFTLRELVDHARLLSLFARGAQLQYEKLLLEMRREEVPGHDHAFAAWLERARADLLAWKLDDFVALTTALRGIRSGDSSFLRGWIERIRRTNSASSLLVDSDARVLVANRERDKRRTKARLRSEYHLKSWQPPKLYGDDLEPYQLHFRHSIGHSIASDIVDGLLRGKA